MRPVLLHLITPGDWRAALRTGAVVPPSLADVGFVHLSTPEQVHLPANRLYAGRTDLALLVVDPDRLTGEVRYEPGVPSDPASMRFPHLYAPLPTRAVLAVVPYRPVGGAFAAPALPPLDAAARVAGVEPAQLRRIATTERAVPGGVVVTTAPVPRSTLHNRLVAEGPVTAEEVAAVTAEHLATQGLRRAASLYGDNADTAAKLTAAGWEIDEIVLMGRAPGGPVPGSTTLVDVERLRPFWDATWRRTLPDADAETLRQLTDRHLLAEAVTDVRYPAVVADGQVVAAARLTIDGATAWVDAVDTDPAHRGRGHGDAVLAHALALAGEAGCDLVGLGADAADWPQHWYARRGFAELGRYWEAARD